ncbi:MAG: ABC transporter permease, partial [Bacteroidia bacterium]
MYSILKKEIRSFLSSLIAYVVMIVFLIAIGLFMWVLPDYNVFDTGYADLSTLFNMAPWVFIFLISAITMRSFGEEKKNGTIEIITTKPVSDLEIILGKYFA